MQPFAANQKKAADIISIFVANRSKLLRLLGDLKIDKGREVMLFLKNLYLVFFFFTGIMFP